MAQVRFEDIDFSSNGTGQYQVGFFSLKNDNDEAVVRIMHDSINDFDILTTHEIREDGKYRGRVSCIRDAKDDLNKCPMCAANLPVTQRMYIHLIQYVRDESGNIVPQAKVWERSVSYANQLKSYIDNYGPLSDVICKIIRHGKAGDQRTRYEIVPNLNKQVYRDDVYVKDVSLFENWKVAGTVVPERSYEDLAVYVQTGKLPVRQQNNPTPNMIPNGNSNVAPVNNSQYVQPAYVNTPVNNPQYQTPSVESQQSVPPQVYTQPNFGVNMSEQNGQQLARPVRSYY